MAKEDRTCRGPDCDALAKYLGLCPAHYQQQRLGKSLTPRRPYVKRFGSTPICSVPDCGRKRVAYGLCKVHRDHMKKYGEVRQIKQYELHGPCDVSGCEEISYAKRRCYKHLSYGYNLARFGITLEDFVRMLEEQKGVCAICGGVNANGKALSVDHDHECCPGDRSCGACVRSLLCQTCNFATGLMHDDPVRLRAAADYIEAHRALVVA